MKNQKIIVFIMLLTISFSAFHAFTIELLDRDHCSVVEYIDEISQVDEHSQKGDICQIHHLFHTPFLLTQSMPFISKIEISQKPVKLYHKHNFSYLDKLFKPPTA